MRKAQWTDAEFDALQQLIDEPETQRMKRKCRRLHGRKGGNQQFYEWLGKHLAKRTGQPKRNYHSLSAKIHEITYLGDSAHKASIDSRRTHWTAKEMATLKYMVESVVNRAAFPSSAEYWDKVSRLLAERTGQPRRTFRAVDLRYRQICEDPSLLERKATPEPKPKEPAAEPPTQRTLGEVAMQRRMTAMENKIDRLLKALGE